MFGGRRRRDRYEDLDSLVRDMHADMVRVAYTYVGDDADDVIQNACIGLFRNWHTLQAMAEVGRQRSYAWTTVINAARKHRASAYQRHVRPHGDMERVGEIGYLPKALDEVRQDAEERLVRACRVIDGLTPACREVAVLALAGYEVKEISTMLGVSASTVRTQVSTARSRLEAAETAHLGTSSAVSDVQGASETGGGRS
ncbi:RNA polymerase sigma factor [Embleya hyalina]|nr:sigma-70 family RNA polymerase sigma factor [Embleya hyalina]